MPKYIVGVPNQIEHFSFEIDFKASDGLNDGCGNTSLVPLIFIWDFGILIASSIIHSITSVKSVDQSYCTAIANEAPTQPKQW